MAVQFSKVTLTADNGNTASFLCSGCPINTSDLADWTAYQRFMSDNHDCKSVKAEVETYLYGEGDVNIANEYEVAYFTRRGEDFLTRSTVHRQGSSSFTIYPPDALSIAEVIMQ